MNVVPQEPSWKHIVEELIRDVSDRREPQMSANGCSHKHNVHTVDKRFSMAHHLKNVRLFTCVMLYCITCIPFDFQCKLPLQRSSVLCDVLESFRHPVCSNI